MGDGGAHGAEERTIGPLGGIRSGDTRLLGIGNKLRHPQKLDPCMVSPPSITALPVPLNPRHARPSAIETNKATVYHLESTSSRRINPFIFPLTISS